MTMRICINCEHFRFDSGSPDWSDITPGDPVVLECAKGHWDAVEHQRTRGARDRGELRVYLAMAETCPDWEPAKDLTASKT